jgi:hypothetical protein
VRRGNWHKAQYIRFLTIHGEDPYIVHDLATMEARRTSFRDVLDDDGTGHSKP